MSDPTFKPYGIADNLGLFGEAGAPLRPPAATEQWNQATNAGAPSLMEGIQPAVREAVGTTPSGGPGVDANGNLTLEQPDQGGGNDRSALDEGNRQILSELGMRPHGAGPTGPAVYHEPEGESYASVGGKKLYEEAFRGAPGRRDQAMQEQAALEAQKHGELEKFYGEQSGRDKAAAAAMMAAGHADQAELQARQQKLDAATRYYTDDLADQNKFWTNPGNIVAAISFSLMPIFSNDPSIGIKTINNAIQQDMANRQHAASQTLGALQSNLHGYRQIAGDRQAGDLLAQAESHRIAAQEIARIGQKFEGPLAQKKMQALIADQQTRQAAAEMQFRKADISTKPSKMDIGLHNARAIGGEDGWRPLGGMPDPMKAQGPTGNAVRGEVAGSPSTASDKPISPTMRAVIKTGGIRGVDQALSRGAIEDGQVQNAVVASMYAEGRAKYPHDQPEQAYAKILEAADKELVPVAPLMAKDAKARTLVANLSKKMDIIERSERGEGKDPQEFISWARSNWPDSWVKQYQAFTSKDPSRAASDAEKRAMLRQQAVTLFKEEFQQVLNQNVHEMYGGNVSAGESARGESEISQLSTWQSKKAWLRRRDLGLQSEVNSNMIGLTPGARILYRLRTSGGTVNTTMPKVGMPTPQAAPQPALVGQQSVMGEEPGQNMSAPMSQAPVPPRSF